MIRGPRRRCTTHRLALAEDGSCILCRRLGEPATSFRDRIVIGSLGALALSCIVGLAHGHRAVATDPAPIAAAPETQAALVATQPPPTATTPRYQPMPPPRSMQASTPTVQAAPVKTQPIARPPAKRSPLDDALAVVHAHEAQETPAYDPAAVANATTAQADPVASPVPESAATDDEDPGYEDPGYESSWWPSFSGRRKRHVLHSHPSLSRPPATMFGAPGSPRRGGAQRAVSHRH